MSRGGAFPHAGRLNEVRRRLWNNLPRWRRTHRGRRRALWALGVVVILLVVNPALLSARALHDRSREGGAADGQVLTMVDELIGGFQKTTIVVVAALALASFRRLVPVLWSLFQSSLSGMLIAAEMAVIFWLVYGGLAGIGMPGLFWNPDAWTMLRTALGVTLFVYWMLYLVFVHDFEVHGHEPERQVWHRFRPVLEASGLPALLKHPIRENDAAVRLRWFLSLRGAAGAGGPGGPRGASRGTARGGPRCRRVALARGNGAGRQFDRGDRDDTGRNPASRALHATLAAPAQLPKALRPRAQPARPQHQHLEHLDHRHGGRRVFAPRLVCRPEGGDVTFSSPVFDLCDAGRPGDVRHVPEYAGVAHADRVHLFPAGAGGRGRPLGLRRRSA